MILVVARLSVDRVVGLVIGGVAHVWFIVGTASTTQDSFKFLNSSFFFSFPHRHPFAIDSRFLSTSTLSIQRACTARYDLRRRGWQQVRFLLEC